MIHFEYILRNEIIAQFIIHHPLWFNVHILKMRIEFYYDTQVPDQCYRVLVVLLFNTYMDILVRANFPKSTLKYFYH